MGMITVGAWSHKYEGVARGGVTERISPQGSRPWDVVLLGGRVLHRWGCV